MLYLVPTPIGNLQDITLRAIEVLKDVDLIYAEDTRVTQKLLKFLDINKKLFSLHAHNEHKAVEKVIEDLQAGMKIAYVSDAGTPGISDPGYLLIQHCIEKDISYTVLPGATAIIPALVGSGFSCERFVFEGFLPHKKGREKRLKEIIENKSTTVIFESPHRIKKALEQIALLTDNKRRVVVARELSKIYEEYRRGYPSELLDYYNEHPPKGEIVLLLEAKKE